jgi:type I restriction enzyme S subunit
MRPVAELRRVRANDSQVSTWGLRPADLLVNRVNSMSHLGKCIVVPAALGGALFESNMMRIRLVSSVLPRYVELYLGSRIGKRRLTASAKWAVNQASINQKDVQATEIPLPSPERQAQIVAEVDRRLSIVREVEAEVDANLKRAQALRQAVLAKAFQGS